MALSFQQYTPGDRIQVCGAYPHYFQYRGKPLFLYGCNQGWGTSVQDTSFDYQIEFDALHQAGGNLVRITPFMVRTRPGDEDFHETNQNLPWRFITEGPDTGKYVLDLEKDGFNPVFWDRLGECITYACERDIIVSLELWDLYGPARRERWEMHPFYPGNNVSLSAGDELPAETDIRDVAFCRTITRSISPAALNLQEQYIRHILDITSSFPNVMYCMVNETSADRMWSDHWIHFVHRYFSKHRENAPHVAGEMPREYSFSRNITIEELISDPAYDYADISQYCDGRGPDQELEHIRSSREHVGFWQAFMREQPARRKPLACMKMYNSDNPMALWIRLLCGCASARFHRGLAAWVTPYPGNEGRFLDPPDLQIEFVKHLRSFLDFTMLEPWLMEPAHELITDASGIDEHLCMSRVDRTVLVALAYGPDIHKERRLVLELPDGSYRSFFFSPAYGTRTEPRIVKVKQKRITLVLPAEKEYTEPVVYLRRQ